MTATGMLEFFLTLDKFRHLGSGDESVKELDVEIAETLRQQIKAITVDNFVVRPHREVVEKFREPAIWEELSPDGFEELGFCPGWLAQRVGSRALFTSDLSFVKLRDQVKEIAGRLEEKRTIPMVNEQLELILDLQQDEYWADITLPLLENVRKRLRDSLRELK